MNRSVPFRRLFFSSPASSETERYRFEKIRTVSYLKLYNFQKTEQPWLAHAVVINGVMLRYHEVLKLAFVASRVASQEGVK